MRKEVDNMKAEDTPDERKNWKRPHRFPIHMSEDLFLKIENRKWETHRSMNDLINEALEEKFR